MFVTRKRYERDMDEMRRLISREIRNVSADLCVHADIYPDQEYHQRMAARARENPACAYQSYCIPTISMREAIRLILDHLKLKIEVPSAPPAPGVRIVTEAADKNHV